MEIEFPREVVCLGFIGAVYELGKMEIGQSGGGEFEDIDSYLQMPMELIEPSGENPRVLPGKEIRVWLDVSDPWAETLDVRGIADIDSVEFFAGDGEEEDREKKRRYLYRDPPGSNTRWRYSPLYKLGRGVSDGVKELLGSGEWEEDRNSRFCKLRDTTLQAFEDEKFFTPGSVERLMAALVERAEELSQCWDERKRSYILLFGLGDGGRFLYPAELPAFLSHFRFRLKGVVGGGAKKAKKKVVSRTCALCQASSTDALNLDQVFKFATFDKKSFLPGLDSADDSKSKVFPVCADCLRVFSEGRSVLDRKFLDGESIYQVRIYVVPELLQGNASLALVQSKTRDFLKVGLQNESCLAEHVLEQDDSLVYHFVFWEKNQAQERLLLMVEDVPPSRLNRLGQCWEASALATGLFGGPDRFAPEEGSTRTERRYSALDQAVRTLVRTLTSLAGKNDNDVNVLKDWVLGIVGRLLNGQLADIRSVKGFVVTRLQGLCSNPEWVSRNASHTMRRLNAIIDFLCRVEASRKSDFS
ncbi:MAG: hypothetical protein GX256_07485 [Fretibacterium sp.]|nr:hypothetical protein [Fretibacterium sp.]